MFVFSFLHVKINKYHSTSKTLPLFPQWVRSCPFRKTSSDVLPVQSVVKKQATSRTTYLLQHLLLLQRIGRKKDVNIKRFIVLIMMLFSRTHHIFSFSALHSLTTHLFCPPFRMTRHRPSPQFLSVKSRKKKHSATMWLTIGIIFVSRLRNK